MLAFAGALLSVAGLWAYEKFFFRSSWRQLYLWVTFVVVVFSFLQVLLVLKKTGIFSPYTFAMGDTVVVAFVQNVAFMPMSALRRGNRCLHLRSRRWRRGERSLSWSLGERSASPQGAQRERAVSTPSTRRLTDGYTQVHHVLSHDPGRRGRHGLRLAVDVAERRDGGRLPTGHVLTCVACF